MYSRRMQFRPSRKHLISKTQPARSFGGTHKGEEWGELGGKVTVRHDEENQLRKKHRVGYESLSWKESE